MYTTINAEFSQPQSWDETKKLLLASRRNGIESQNLPASFALSPAMLDVFAEMLPEEHGLASRVKDFKRKTGREPLVDEVFRAIVTQTGEELLVQSQNKGKAARTILGNPSVTREMPIGTFGGIHTHPIDSMPSSVDLEVLVCGITIIEIIVTPRRVHVLLRTTQTPNLGYRVPAKGYLHSVGVKQGLTQDLSVLGLHGSTSDLAGDLGAWTATDGALKELHIARYEASRGKTLFERKC